MLSKFSVPGVCHSIRWTVRFMSSSFSTDTTLNNKNGNESELSLPQWVPQWKGTREAGAEEYKSPTKMVGKELKSWRSSSMEVDGLVNIPRETDVLIVGGGLVGQAIAYFLKREHRRAIKVTIVERDPTHKISSSALTVAGIRQQFSIPENVELSLFGADFLRRADEYLGIEGLDPVSVPFQLGGYMFLAETDQGASVLERNVKMQRDLGAVVSLLAADEIKKRFPWMNVDNIKLGSLGLENEGCFDQWALMGALKMRNLAWGVRYVHGDVLGFEFTKAPGAKEDSVVVSKAVVRDLSPKNEGKGLHAIKFWRLAVATGAWSGELASKIGIGRVNGPMDCRQPLPVEPRKRYVYVLRCPKGPGLNCPMLIDSSGLYLRREGYADFYICGKSPGDNEPEPDPSDLDIDYDYFTEVLWPILASRAPCFEETKITSAWAGYYDYNCFDQNLVIGPHPHFKNVLFACGLSGHGIQHAVGIGRAISELVYYDKYQTIDLSRFHFDRFVLGQKLLEEDERISYHIQ